MRNFRIPVYLAALYCCLIFPSWSQDRKGLITGTVTDATHGVLRGAQVQLKPIGRPTATNTSGRFAITDLDAGSYTVTISYVGLETYTKEVTVSAAQETHIDAELQVGNTSQEVTVVADHPRGEAAAINQQKTADNILEVLPAEVITSLPNINIADALGRLPDVSLERDEGEGKYVQIRGTEPRLTNLTVNGVNLPSPESSVRNIKLDVIPADLVESIEVSKTLSASQEGDAIGGSVNLITKTAVDTPTVVLSGLGGYTPIAQGRHLHQEDGTIGKRFGAEKKLGLLFGGTFDYNNRGIYDIEPNPAVNGGADLRDYRYDRSRYGFGGTVDYHLPNGSDIYLKGLFSDFRDYGDRWVYSPALGAQLSDGTYDNTGSVGFNVSIRRPEYFVSSETLGGHQTLGSFFIDYEFSVGRSGQDGGDPAINFNGPTGVQFGLNLKDPYRPQFHVVNGVNIFDPSLYTVNNYETYGFKTRQQNYAGSADLTRNYVLGNVFGAFQAGFKIRDAHKTANSNNQYYNANDPTALSASNFQDGRTEPGYYDGSYAFGPLTSYYKARAFFNSNPGLFTLDTNTAHQNNDPSDFDTSERVYAGYLMNTFDFGKIRLQTGLRIESTDSRFTGNKLLLDSNGNYVSTVPQPGSSTYTNLLPSVQLRYAVTSETNVRAVYGMGISRPNFGDLPPYQTVDQSSNHLRIDAGNPKLKPTSANDFDFLVEHFIRPLGVISGRILLQGSGTSYLLRSDHTHVRSL